MNYKVRKQIAETFLQQKQISLVEENHREHFINYLKNKELNDMGDILLDNDYQELKKSDNKDYYKEAVN